MLVTDPARDIKGHAESSSTSIPIPMPMPDATKSVPTSETKVPKPVETRLQSMMALVRKATDRIALCNDKLADVARTERTIDQNKKEEKEALPPDFIRGMHLTLDTLDDEIQHLENVTENITS